MWRAGMSPWLTPARKAGHAKACCGETDTTQKHPIVCIVNLLLVVVVCRYNGEVVLDVKPWACDCGCATLRLSPCVCGPCGAGPVTVAWTLKSLNRFFSSAVVGADGTVYVGCSDNNMYGSACFLLCCPCLSAATRSDNVVP